MSGLLSPQSPSIDRPPVAPRSGLVGSWLSDERRERLLSAEAYVDKALKLRPDSATAHCALGVLRMYGNRAAQGIAECERALAIDRNFAAAHGYIGMAKILAGRNEETEAHILEALRIRPRDSNAWALDALRRNSQVLRGP